MYELRGPAQKQLHDFPKASQSCNFKNSDLLVSYWGEDNCAPFLREKWLIANLGNCSYAFEDFENCVKKENIPEFFNSLRSRSKNGTSRLKLGTSAVTQTNEADY